MRLEVVPTLVLASIITLHFYLYVIDGHIKLRTYRIIYDSGKVKYPVGTPGKYKYQRFKRKQETIEIITNQILIS